MFGTQITLSEALALLPGATKQKLDRIVETYSAFKYGTGKDTRYIKEVLHLAINVEYIKDLYGRYKSDWLTEYHKINAGQYENTLIYNLKEEDILRNNFPYLKMPDDSISENLFDQVAPIQKDVDWGKPLKRIQRKAVKNVTISIYCKQCRCNIESLSKKDSGCIHPSNKQYYRARHTVPKEVSRKSFCKVLEARTIEGALLEAKRFKDEYYISKTVIQINSKPALLIDTIKIYGEYVENKGGLHTIKTNTKNHIKDIKRNLHYMHKALEFNGYNVNRILAVQITREMGQKVSVYLRTQIGLTGSHNRAVGQLSSFFKWLIDFKGYLMTNPFYKVERYKPETNPVALETKTFFAIMDLLANPINYLNHPENPGINHTHAHWLKIAYTLSALTGRRREELIGLRWSSIITTDKATKILQGENLKIVRQKNQLDGTKKRMFNIPLFPELKKFLLELGYEEKIGSNDYIIYPENEQSEYRISRRQMKEKLSRSFAFLIQQVENNQGKLSFRSIRKIFTSRAKKMYASNAGILTDHISGDILDKHYVDTSEFLEEVERGFYVFEPVNMPQPILEKIQ